MEALRYLRADIVRDNSFGYEWMVTFTSIESPSNVGVQDLFKIDDAKLMGTSVVTEVMRLQRGCCEFSLHLNGYEVSDRLLFRYDDVTVATKIYPSSGPSSGGTLVIVRVTSIPFSKSIFCVFGSSSIMENNVHAEWLNSTHISCLTPAQDKAYSVPVRIRTYSLMQNQSQFSKTKVFFNYYLPPSISHIVPNFGPPNGGYGKLLYMDRILNHLPR